MKYVVFWEFCPEDFDKVVEKFRKYIEEVEKFPEKYPEVLFPSHSIAGETKGLQVVEATAEQLANQSDYFRTLMKYKYVPVLEGSKAIEASIKMKE